MGSCCGKKQGDQSELAKRQRALNSLNQNLDAKGRPKHRSRGEAFTQEQMIYEEITEMAKLSAMQPLKFIQKTKAAKIHDFSKYVGFEYTIENCFILESGREIESTLSWNPLTFALVFEIPELTDYILYEVNFGIQWLLAIGLPEVTAWGNRNFTDDELMNGQIETLMLLVENKKPGFFTILNQFHQHLSPKLIKNLIARVSRTKFGPQALE